MTEKEIEEYQKNLCPWIPEAEVTCEDVVISGFILEPAMIANDIIEKMIASG